MRLAAALLLCAAAARAWPDPRTEWLTLDTPHFEVHFHQGEYRLAARMARLAEEAHRRLSPVLDHRPRERTQLVVADDTDFANGSATPLLYGVVRANAAPPDVRSTLADFDDWAWQLLAHEYAHILHLDTVGGIPEVANRVFGKLWIPNGVQPAWLIEGLAVLEESEVSSAGRARSSLESMLLRTEALSGTFPALDLLSNPTLQYPRGDIPYAVGGRFLAWLDGRFGAGALRDLSHDYGARFIPFALNLSASRVLGKSWIDLYAEFRSEELGRARATAAEVRAGGETKGEPLTRLGEEVGSPRWSRDGARLYYASAGPDRRPEVRVLSPGPCCDPGTRLPGQVRPEDRRLATGEGELRLAVAPGGALVWSRPEVFQESAVVEDLWRLDADGTEERLTRGLRAREPDVARDGAIAFTQRRPGGRTALAVLDPGASEPRTVYEDPEGGVVSSPRFSPSGEALAFLHHRGAAWELRLVGRDGAGLSDLLGGRAVVRDPSWSPDGRHLLFSSDRSGVFDVYALRLADRTLLRATRALTGAFEPELSPDGAQLAYVHFGPRGYDLARVPLDLERLPPAGPARAEAERPAPFAPPPEELYPVRPYDPLPTLLPKWWLPTGGADALGGATVGAFSSGADVLGRTEWAATLWWGIESRLPGWDLSFTSHALYPDLSLSFSRDLVVPAGLPGNAERRVAGAVAVRVPWSLLGRAFAATLRYELQHLAAHVDPLGLAPPDGLLAALAATLSYTDARRFARGVSAEEGQRASVTLRVADPALGGRFAFWQLSGAFARYLALPWTWGGRPLHHALALRLSGGVAQGDLSRRHRFSLGGFDQSDLVQSVLSPATAGLTVLRGFASDAFAGEAFALGTLEYRLPLVDVETGAWTLPVYLRRLHAAAFADAGDAFTPGRGDLALQAGVGAELRAEVVLGWGLPSDLRLGCARGLGDSPWARWDCYLALGGIF